MAPYDLAGVLSVVELSLDWNCETEVLEENPNVLEIEPETPRLTALTCIPADTDTEMVVLDSKVLLSELLIPELQAIWSCCSMEVRFSEKVSR